MTRNTQDWFDSLASKMQTRRSSSQMTLGKLISELEKYPPDTQISNIFSPHSYRGYYCDLAFEPGEGTRLVGDLLDEAKDCLDKVFEGYKGGSFQMDENTPVWIAEYGKCGIKIVGIAKGLETLAFLTQEDI